MFFLYQFIITLLLFLSPIILVNRILRKKEDIRSIQEKLSFSTKKSITDLSKISHTTVEDLAESLAKMKWSDLN